MAKARIESRIKNGVEVYDVGKQQLWSWAHWAAAGAGNAQAWHGIPQTIEVMADSLAKGSYLVMELQFCSPVADDGEKPCIQDAKVVLKPGAMVSTRSLREALELVEVYRIDGYPCGDGDALTALVEIWHIVDDGDLWREWDIAAAKAGGDASKEYEGLAVSCFEVFEVGKEQLKRLFGYWADIDYVTKGFEKIWKDRRPIGLVLETIQNPSGEFDEPRLVSWISSFEVAREVIATELDYAHSFGNEPIYEIWIVRDDAELWQKWEMEVAAAGGNLLAAQAWHKVFHDDTYLRRIEEQYEGAYYVYDTMCHSRPTCIAEVSQYDLVSGTKYIYEHWELGVVYIKQLVESTSQAGLTCRMLRNDGYEVEHVNIIDVEKWDCLEVLREDGTTPAWCPLRVCFVSWAKD